MRLNGTIVDHRQGRTQAGTGVVDLPELLAIFRRRKWSIIWTIVVGTALAGVVGEQREPSYTATADILMTPMELIGL